MLGVTRQTIHNWAAAFQQNPGVRALDDDYGIGRPTLWTAQLTAALQAALRLRPHQLGYQAANWTVPLLCVKVPPLI